MGEPDRQQDDIDTRRVLLTGVTIAGAVLLAVAVSWILVAVLGSPTTAEHGAAPRAGPQLEVHPLQDLAAYRAHEQLKLSGYQWVDRQAGIVRIPIDRAMEVVAAHNERAPGRPPASGDAAP